MVRRHLVRRGLFLSLSLCVILYAAEEEVFPDLSAALDSAAVDTLSSDWSVGGTLWMQAHPLLMRVVAWPFEKVIQPALSFLLSPLEPPLEYFFDNEVPERALDLVTFGADKNRVIYPFFGLSSGTGTVYGVAYRQESVQKPQRYSFDLGYEQSVALDKILNSEVSLLLPGDFASLSGALTKRNVRSKTFYMPRGGDPLLYSDSSFFLSGGLSFSLFSRWSLSLGMEQSWNRFMTADEVIVWARGDEEDPFRFTEKVEEMEKQGLYRDYEEKVYRLSLGYNSLENRFAPTEGIRWSLSAKWGEPEILSSYLLFSGRLELAQLLGKQPYELTREENREQLRHLRRFSFDDAMEFIQVDQLRKIYLERKVLTNYLTWSRVVALEEGPIPVMALPSLGRHSPLRAYDNRRYSDRSTLLWSAEYRWPLLRQVDGVFFNEYGYFYPGEEHFFDGELRNSWGFGVRLRNPNFYFFRMQLAFHGHHGISMLLTVRPEFWR